MKTRLAKDRLEPQPPGHAPTPRLTADDVAALPATARRYMKFMGVVGRPRDWSFRLAWRGSFRPRLDRPWMPCEAWQYNSGLEIARDFRMRLRFWGFVPVIGRDTYRAGRGRLRIRLLDLLTIADGKGPEYDLGELVTWLDDAVLFAPSMLLTPAVSWTAVDEESFDLALTDAGRTVHARVRVNGRGAPLEVETIDRFLDDPANAGHLIRARWTTPIDRWETVGDRPVPTSGRALWHLPEGARPYARFEVIPESVAWNVLPED